MTNVREMLWRLIAMLAAWKPVTDQLYRIAQKTPYQHIMSADGRDTYMARYWLLNPYDRETGKRKYRWLPVSARIHWILREDLDRHLHDHPWNARTIILRGYYIEEREDRRYARVRGDTQRLRYGEYHRIERVSPGGVLTLFITGPKRGEWGFMVDGEKVHWREYLGLNTPE